MILMISKVFYAINDGCMGVWVYPQILSETAPCHIFQKMSLIQKLFTIGKYPREDNLRTAPKGPRRGLQFNTLLELSKETTTPIEVVEKIGASGGRLKELIEDNQTNVDVLELVLVMIGHFCKNNGRTLFSSAFANMVQILGEGNMFAQIFHIVMQIPRSRSKNLPSAEDRINALLTSVNHLTLDILIMMPAFACNALGEDFFLTMKSLKDVHPLNNMNLDFSFQSFDEGNRRLKVYGILFIIIHISVVAYCALKMKFTFSFLK